MTDIIYRLLTADDIASYKRVRLACLRQFPDYFGSTFEEQVPLPAFKMDAYIRNLDADGFMYGAFEQETLMGICGFVRESRRKTQHRGEITQLYVAPELTGRGVGERLLRCCVEKAFGNPQIEQLTLGVVAQNQKAIYMYEKVGFKQYGYLENYLKSDDTYSAQVFKVLTRSDYQFRY